MQKNGNIACLGLAELLCQYGVRDVVTCPGSRNAPLVTAVCALPSLLTTTVCDERSAAFVALGMAVQTGRPTAVICTSGTALLNMAPAVAEAYYRHVPLIVLSADRPTDMIDNGHAQTVRQPGALSNIVLATVDIDTGDDASYCDRLANQAMTIATVGTIGPVHINVHICDPSDNVVAPEHDMPRKINVVTAPPLLSTATARELARMLMPPKRVMMLCGAMPPNAKLNRAMSRLSNIPNVAVVAEPLSNLHGDTIIYNGDAVLAAAKGTELLPDVVVTMGAPLVSTRFTPWLSHANAEHWAVTPTTTLCDTYGRLTRQIQLPPSTFMGQLASAMQPFRQSASNYNRMWREASAMTTAHTDKYILTAPWTDLTAVYRAIQQTPPEYNLQVSNGMAVRLLALAHTHKLHRIDCNRGVSGIDGCTSTAIGAAMATDTPTLLIIGDMSAQYDIGALAIDGIPDTFRIMVLSNNGGNIFRIISATRNADHREQCFAANVNLPLQQLAQGFGFEYYHADRYDSFDIVFKQFISTDHGKAILNIVVDGQTSANAYMKIFSNT